MYLPPPLRRRLDKRDARIRAEGAARVRSRRARDRTRYRYVFVVAYGRSGSTLVQGLLNTMPRTVVAGENNLYVLYVYRALAAMREFRQQHKRHGMKEPTTAFYRLGRIRRGPFVQAMNDIVTAGIIGRDDPRAYDVVGFKEVRWYLIEPEETDGFFAAMDEAFPDVRYVLNTAQPRAGRAVRLLEAGRHRRGTGDHRADRGHPGLPAARADRTACSTSPYEDLVDAGAGRATGCG